MCRLKRRPARGRKVGWLSVSRKYQIAATTLAPHQTPNQRVSMFSSRKVCLCLRATKWYIISIYIKWKFTWNGYSGYKIRESIILKYVFIGSGGTQKHLCDHQKRDVCAEAVFRTLAFPPRVCSRLTFCTTNKKDFHLMPPTSSHLCGPPPHPTPLVVAQREPFVNQKTHTWYPFCIRA